MQLLTFRVADPQNVLDTYGAGALARVERDTVSTFATATEITTFAIVAGTTEYEYRDQTGLPGTHWGRWRISSASPASAADYSGYLASYQYGANAGAITTLEQVKNHANIPATDTTDDGRLALYVASTNGELIRRLGFDPSPSPDTTRTYDACDAQLYGTRLYVPGGIRAFTAVEVSTDGSTWTAVTSDVRVGPLSHARLPGDPGWFIEFKPYTTGGITSFDGYVYVRITGTAFETFGYPYIPDVLSKLADMIVLRMWNDRQAGTLSSPTPSKFIYPDDAAMLREIARDNFPVRV